MRKNTDGLTSKVDHDVERLELSQDEHLKFLVRMALAVIDSIYSLGPDIGGDTISKQCIMGSIADATFHGTSESVSSLARKYNLPKSTVTFYVTGLLGAGRIKETVDPDDRRKHCLTLSSAGVDTALVLCDRINEMREQAHADGQPMLKLYTVK